MSHFIFYQRVWRQEHHGPLLSVHGNQRCAVDLPAGDVAKQVAVIRVSHAENLTHHVRLPGRSVDCSYISQSFCLYAGESYVLCCLHELLVDLCAFSYMHFFVCFSCLYVFMERYGGAFKFISF